MELVGGLFRSSLVVVEGSLLESLSVGLKSILLSLDHASVLVSLSLNEGLDLLLGLLSKLLKSIVVIVKFVHLLQLRIFCKFLIVEHVKSLVELVELKNGLLMSILNFLNVVLNSDKVLHVMLDVLLLSALATFILFFNEALKSIESSLDILIHGRTSERVPVLSSVLLKLNCVGISSERDLNTVVEKLDVDDSLNWLIDLISDSVGTIIIINELMLNSLRSISLRLNCDVPVIVTRGSVLIMIVSSHDDERDRMSTGSSVVKSRTIGKRFMSSGVHEVRELDGSGREVSALDLKPHFGFFGANLLEGLGHSCDLGFRNIFSGNLNILLSTSESNVD